MGNSAPPIDWQTLSIEFPDELVAELRERMATIGPLELTADDLLQETSETDASQALRLLRELVSARALTEETRFACCHCSYRMTSDELATGTCPRCDSVFEDAKESPERLLVFVRTSAPSRDVPWVLCVHGMNTTGAWQEEFNWIVSTAYSHAVPVAIYKYGIVRPGAFFRFRHRSLAGNLASKIRALAGTSQGSGFGKRPDVIAHSLGTLLLNKLLQSNADIQVGRVVLLGCIVRPDSDWHDLIEKGQVDAVLNHFGTKDFWALVAHYFIPDSGPSGRRGFNYGSGTINIAEEGLGHSGFFDSSHLTQLFEDRWRPFLTLPVSELDQLDESKKDGRKWNQTWWVFRATIPRLILVLVFFVGITIAASSLILGLVDIFRWLRS